MTRVDAGGSGARRAGARRAGARRLLGVVVAAGLGVGLFAAPAAADPIPTPGSVGTGSTTVTAWGSNEFGQATVPASLTGKAVVAVAASFHSLALTSDGQVTGWGNNNYKQTEVPASLTGKTVTAVAAGDSHSLALTSDGQVTAWGNNGYHQTEVPASLTGKTVTAFTSGDSHNLALTSDGQVTGWGDNRYGQATVPASLTGKTVTAFTAGYNHSLALTSDGQVTGWGNNTYHQTEMPASLTGKTVTAVAAGTRYSLALTSDGQVTGWGDNNLGQATVPASLTGKTVTAISAGYEHSLALTSDGQVTAWGYNNYGQSTVPVSLTGETVVAIAAGDFHSLAVTSTAAPRVVTDPVTQTVAVGQRVVLTAAVAPEGYPPTAQWQMKSTEQGMFNNIGAPTTTNHTTRVIKSVPAVINGTQYRVVFTNKYGRAITAPATLTVQPAAAPVITGQPAGATVPAGEHAVFTAAASGLPAPTVQWQWANPGSDTFTNITVNGTDTTYTTPAQPTINSGGRYRAVFSNQAGTTTTTPAAIAVTGDPVITVQPQPVTIPTGYQASFTAATNDPAAFVQWQSQPPHTTGFTNIPGATNRETIPGGTISSHTTTPLTPSDDGTQYRAVFSNPLTGHTITTNPATATLTIGTLTPHNHH